MNAINEDIKQSREKKCYAIYYLRGGLINMEIIKRAMIGILVVIILTIYVFITLYINEIKYWMQTLLLSNDSTIFINPTSFSSFWGIVLFPLFTGILLYLFFKYRRMFLDLRYLVALVVWVTTFYFILFGHTRFDQESFFHKSMLHPLGKTYEYSDIAKVDLYVLRERFNGGLKYRLTLKDNTKIYVRPTKFDIRRFEFGNRDFEKLLKLQNTIVSPVPFIVRGRDFPELSDLVPREILQRFKVQSY